MGMEYLNNLNNTKFNLEFENAFEIYLSLAKKNYIAKPYNTSTLSHFCLSIAMNPYCTQFIKYFC